MAGWKTGQRTYTLIDKAIATAPAAATLDIHGLDTGDATDISTILNNTSLRTINADDWTGSAARTRMTYLFSNSPNLTTVSARNLATARATNLAGMFAGDAKLTDLKTEGWDITGLDASSPTSPVDGMFAGDTALTALDMAGWKTGQRTYTLIDKAIATAPAAATLDIHGLDTGDAASIDRILANLNLTGINADDWTGSAARTTMTYLFLNDTNLTTVSARNLATARATSLAGMFQGDAKLTDLDLSGWDTSKVSDMGATFWGCASLATLDLSGWKTGSATSMASMFANDTALTSLNLHGWDTRSVSSMAGMFSGDTVLASLDMAGWDTRSVTNMGWMFYNDAALAGPAVSGWDTSKVSDMRSMFQGCSSLAGLDLSGWKTGSATSMASMFANDTALTSLDLHGWDTSKVAYMQSMFQDDAKLEDLKMDGWSTVGLDASSSSVNPVDGMFAGDAALTALDMAGWKTGQRTYTLIDKAIATAPAAATLDIHGLDTGDATDISTILNNTSLRTINADDWTGSAARTRMTYLFSNSPNLTTVSARNLATARATNLAGMFAGDAKLTDLKTEGWDITGLDASSPTSPVDGMFAGDTALTALDMAGWKTGQRTYTLIDKAIATAPAAATLDIHGLDTGDAASIDRILANLNLTGINADDWTGSAARTTMTYLFLNDTNLTTVSARNLATARATSLAGMFQGDAKLTDLDLSGWDTSKVSDMGATFWGCASLATLDLSGWKTGSATSMASMFANDTALTSLNLHGWDTRSVSSMAGMFSGDTVLASLDMAGWDTRSVTNMGWMFYNDAALAGPAVSGWDTSKVSDMRSMFQGCSSLAGLDLSGWKTGSATSMASMFANDTALTSLDLHGWDTSKVAYMQSMFQDDAKLEDLKMDGWSTVGLDASSSSVNPVDGMFAGDAALTALDMAGWKTGQRTYTLIDKAIATAPAAATLDIHGLDTGDATDISTILNNTSLRTINADDWTGSAARTRMTYLFSNSPNLTTVSARNLATARATNLAGMFAGDAKLTDLKTEGWDITGLDASSPTSPVDGMFAGDTALTALDMAGWKTGQRTYTLIDKAIATAPAAATLDIHGLDTGDAASIDRILANLNLTGINADDWTGSAARTTMTYLFLNDTNLTTVSARNLATARATSLAGMFQGDAKLTDLDLSGWDTSKVSDMGATFWGCASLATLDLSGWKTGSATSMASMFANDTALTSLNLHGWDTRSVSSMAGMFSGDTVLASLDMAGWDTRSVTNMGWMFYNDTNIKQIRLDQHTDTLIPSIRSDVFPASRNLIVMVEGETTTTGGQGSFASDKAEDSNYKVNQATWFKVADRGIIYSGSSSYGIYPPACVSWSNDSTSTCTVAGSAGLTPPMGQQLLSWKSTTDNTTYRPGQTVSLTTPSFVTVTPQWGILETVSALPLTGADKHQTLVKMLLLAAALLTLATTTVLRNRQRNSSAE
ncbi:BspA family leucine-rich repeat surface protein [Bifidobacterium sp. ESL0728]|uniref:BspA family leucine-rich repeat surface protein n=1 Tax=Bifidobacterium sp. ESL0728 TaxID=2983220 RepID=UPI0023F6A883|nr:BspA family leucine-rich repeat surface protein [Bifidobacterium sp. ESL0728]WEV59233.1 BspA family leucine-rich repeat surface protein [Bifidobacterium sp. ESL0728]